MPLLVPSPETLEELRDYISDEKGDEFSDEQLIKYLNRHIRTSDPPTFNVHMAAADIWQKRAGQYADAVDADESGSQRRWSQLHKHAKDQALMHRSLGTGGIGAINPNAPVDPAHGRRVVGRVASMRETAVIPPPPFPSAPRH